MTDSDIDIKLFVLEEFVERNYPRITERFCDRPEPFFSQLTRWDIRKAQQAAVAWVHSMTDRARRLPPVRFEAVGISSRQCPECGSMVEHRDGVAWLQIHPCVGGAMRRVRAA